MSQRNVCYIVFYHDTEPTSNLFVMSQRNAYYINLSQNRACETSIQFGWLRGLGRHESRRHEMSLDGSEGLVGMWLAQKAWSA